MEKIEIGTHRDQITLLEEMSKIILDSDPRIESLGLNYIPSITDAIESIGVKEDHTPLTTNGISFDVIRKYEYDSKNILVSATPTPYENYIFYSQIQNPDLVNYIRLQYNDTDYFRFQYALSQLHETLCFTPERSYFKLINIINLYIFHILLASLSNPVEHYSANNLYQHYLSNIFDTTIRSICILVHIKSKGTPSEKKKTINQHDSGNGNIFGSYSDCKLFGLRCSIVDNEAISKRELRKSENRGQRHEVRAHTDLYSRNRPSNYNISFGVCSDLWPLLRLKKVHREEKCIA